MAGRAVRAPGGSDSRFFTTTKKGGRRGEREACCLGWLGKCSRVFCPVSEVLPGSAVGFRFVPPERCAHEGRETSSCSCSAAWEDERNACQKHAARRLLRTSHATNVLVAVEQPIVVRDYFPTPFARRPPARLTWTYQARSWALLPVAGHAALTRSLRHRYRHGSDALSSYVSLRFLSRCGQRRAGCGILHRAGPRSTPHFFYSSSSSPPLEHVVQSPQSTSNGRKPGGSGMPWCTLAAEEASFDIGSDRSKNEIACKSRSRGNGIFRETS